MFSLRKSKRTIHLMIEDYALRIIETAADGISSVKNWTEKPLPKEVIEQGRLQDEVAFYSLMKDIVKELNIKNRQLYFNIPNSMIIMRQLEIPGTVNGKEEIRMHIESEIGKTIHFPFKEPIIDVVYTDNEYVNATTEVTNVTVFAAPAEEVRKYTEVFDDVDLKPLAADVGMLGAYRYFHHMHDVFNNRVYLLVEFNMTSIHLSIFHQNQIEFLRYQELDLNLKQYKLDIETAKLKWKYEESAEMVKGLMEDQVTELERIMNFYRYSLHQGEKNVTDIVLLGDYPELGNIYRLIKNTFEDLNVSQVHGHELEKTGDVIPTAFVPTLGLALRGGISRASRS